MSRRSQQTVHRPLMGVRGRIPLQNASTSAGDEAIRSGRNPAEYLPERRRTGGFNPACSSQDGTKRSPGSGSRRIRHRRQRGLADGKKKASDHSTRLPAPPNASGDPFPPPSGPRCASGGGITLLRVLDERRRTSSGSPGFPGTTICHPCAAQTPRRAGRDGFALRAFSSGPWQKNTGPTTAAEPPEIIEIDAVVRRSRMDGRISAHRNLKRTDALPKTYGGSDGLSTGISSASGNCVQPELPTLDSSKGTG